MQIDWLTSTNPKKQELISPAGNLMAIIFSVIYVIFKSKPPSWGERERELSLDVKFEKKNPK